MGHFPKITVDSYEAPQNDAATGSASEGTAKKKGRTVAVTTEDMQKKRNDVKARTTLLLALPDEHQLRFNKHKTAQELWAAILKIFGGNEATKKTKKNLLKQQYDNFKADELNSQNMAFTSSAKNSSGNGEVNTASIPTASTQVSPDGPNIDEDDIEEMDIKWNMALLSMRADRFWPNPVLIMSKTMLYHYKLGLSQVEARLIDEDDIEEMDIKWNMALLSMRADRFWKKIGKKISIQGTDVAGFDKSKVECFNCHKMSHFARECRAPRSQERGRRENYRQGSKEEEQAPKALMTID
nr:hypothetical protein [Tanacetum cinerariifolium]